MLKEEHGPDDIASFAAMAGSSAPPDLITEFRAVSHIRDTTTAADIVFDTLQTDGRLDLLRPLVANALAAFRRNEVRALEHALMNDPSTPTAADDQEGEPVTVKPRRRRTAVAVRPPLHDLLDNDFFTGSEWVTYRDATVDDYLASITFLQSRIDGLSVTITFRSRCVDAISAHPGATTLADVPEDVVRDVLRNV